ncbi:MAG: hypothetical protein ACLUGU_03635 [Alistipes shahii]
MVAPSLFCDVNGDYRGADGKRCMSNAGCAIPIRPSRCGTPTGRRCR